MALFELRDSPLLLQLILNLLLQDISGDHLPEMRLVVGTAISCKCKIIKEMLTEAWLPLELNVIHNKFIVTALLVLELLRNLCIVQMLDTLVLNGDDWKVVVDRLRLLILIVKCRIPYMRLLECSARVELWLANLV